MEMFIFLPWHEPINHDHTTKGGMLFLYKRKKNIFFDCFFFFLLFLVPFKKKSSIFKVTSNMTKNTYIHPIQFTKICINMSDFEWILKIVIFFLNNCLYVYSIYPVKIQCVYLFWLWQNTAACLSIFRYKEDKGKKDQIKKTNWYTIGKKSVHDMSLDHSPYHLHSLEWLTSSLMHRYKKNTSMYIGTCITFKHSNFFWKKYVFLFPVKGEANSILHCCANLLVCGMC